MKSVFDDVRYALRLMRRRPGFTLAAVSTLALGIGANAAIFSIIHVLSFKPLPYRDPGRVAFVQGWDIAKGESRFSLPQSDMLDLQRHTRALEAISAYRYLSGEPHRRGYTRTRAGLSRDLEYVRSSRRGSRARPDLRSIGRR